MDMVKVFTSQGVTLAAEQLEKAKERRILTATDGIANYMITRTALGTEASIDAPGNRTAFYGGAISGILRNERGTLLQRSAFTVSGTEGVQLLKAFGWEPIEQVYRQYRQLPRSQYPATEAARRGYWFSAISMATRRNLGPFFAQWWVPVGEAAQAVASLPAWRPAEMQRK
jgi:hypothetical protein